MTKTPTKGRRSSPATTNAFAKVVPMPSTASTDTDPLTKGLRAFIRRARREESARIAGAIRTFVADVEEDPTPDKLARLRALYLVTLGVPISRTQGVRRLAVVGIAEQWAPRLREERADPVAVEGLLSALLERLAEDIDRRFEGVTIERYDVAFARFDRPGAVALAAHLLRRAGVLGVRRNAKHEDVVAMLRRATRDAKG
jgi:hypothetical protein